MVRHSSSCIHRVASALSQATAVCCLAARSSRSSEVQVESATLTVRRIRHSTAAAASAIATAAAAAATLCISHRRCACCLLPAAYAGAPHLTSGVGGGIASRSDIHRRDMARLAETTWLTGSTGQTNVMISGKSSYSASHCNQDQIETSTRTIVADANAQSSVVMYIVRAGTQKLFEQMNDDRLPDIDRRMDICWSALIASAQFSHFGELEAWFEGLMQLTAEMEGPGGKGWRLIGDILDGFAFSAPNNAALHAAVADRATAAVQRI